ncbi:LLM class flavin-dependent oxidoreductase [Streptomyces sp. NPDC057456]|uniref:LLM class flavin-dependent oxidoreductase n=1 Tax=Streptomyces sp. NPDC057456 TaxID=3346139 RepID=UPI00367517B7
MNVTVFGATGAIGALTVSELLERGHQVAAYARNPQKVPASWDERVRVVIGEMSDQAAIDSAIAGVDAVVSALGPSMDRKATGLETVAGRGSSTITFPLFDHDEHHYDMLYASKLELLMAVNAAENVSFYGPHRKRPLQNATVSPRPEQPLRIWLGTGGSPDSVYRAVELGLPMFLRILGGTPQHWAQYGRAYRTAWDQAGRPAEQADIAVAVHGYVADTGEKARATYLEYEHRMMAEGMAELGRPAPPRPAPTAPPPSAPTAWSSSAAPTRSPTASSTSTACSATPARSSRWTRRHAPARLPPRHRAPRNRGPAPGPRRTRNALTGPAELARWQASCTQVPRTLPAALSGSITMSFSWRIRTVHE